jgi:hypothetical protein
MERKREAKQTRPSKPSRVAQSNRKMVAGKDGEGVHVQGEEKAYRTSRQRPSNQFRSGS